MKPPSYLDITNLISGSWDPGIKKRKEEKQDICPRSSFIPVFHFLEHPPSWMAVLSSNFMEIYPRLAQFPHGPQTFQLLPSFLPRQDLHSPLAARKQSDWTDWHQFVFHWSFLYQSILHACIIKSVLQIMSNGWTSGTETDRREKYSVEQWDAV